MNTPTSKSCQINKRSLGDERRARLRRRVRRLPHVADDQRVHHRGSSPRRWRLPLHRTDATGALAVTSPKGSDHLDQASPAGLTPSCRIPRLRGPVGRRELAGPGWASSMTRKPVVEGLAARPVRLCVHRRLSTATPMGWQNCVLRGTHGGESIDADYLGLFGAVWVRGWDDRLA